jgi:hypothetical protein
LKETPTFHVGENPEDEKPKALFTLIGKAGRLETKTLRGWRNPESGCIRGGKPEESLICWYVLGGKKILREEALKINI